MLLWEDILKELNALESSTSDNIQALNNIIRNIQDESAGENDIASIKDIENQIQNSLKRFISLLVDMEMYVKTGGSENQRIILTRFRDVYKDLSGNYHHSKAIADRKSTRIELFSGHYDQSQEDAETQSLLKEMTAAKNSLRLADSFLESASSSYERLLEQKKRLGHSNGVLHGLSSRFPVVNSLMRKIGNRNTRDNVIVAIFISVCVFFCIWYTFH